MPSRFFFRLLAAATPPGDHVADGELLRRFTRDRDAAAFELLLHRHAPAVWTACRSIVPCEADAEDVFQATFLVLAKKAGSVRNPCIGGWLHRVAVNAAIKLKAGRKREQPGLHSDSLLAGTHFDSLEAEEAAAALQEEIARLPERYRLPIVLCDFEGLTHAEAAKTLGWPVGTVSGRLSRAHALLRSRLTRRGLAPAAIAAGSLAAVEPRLVAAAFANALGSQVPPSVSLLAQGILSTMRTAKMKLAATVVISASLLGIAGAGTFVVFAQPPVPEPGTKSPPAITAAVSPEKPIEGDWLGDPPTAFPDLKVPERIAATAWAKAFPLLLGKNSISIKPADDTYRRLLKAQLRQAMLEIQGVRARIEIGQFQSTELHAFLQLCGDSSALVAELWTNEPNKLIPWLEELVILGKLIERFSRARVQASSARPGELNAARRHRLKAEAALWKAKHPKRAAK